MSTAQPHALERARRNQPATQPQGLRTRMMDPLLCLDVILSTFTKVYCDATTLHSGCNTARLTVLQHADRPGRNAGR